VAISHKKREGDNAKSMTESSRAFFVLSVVMAVGLLGLFLYAFQASTFGSALARVGVGMTAATASMVVGGMLGFLFGIPHTSQGDQPSMPRTDESPRDDSGIDYKVNTNLEQISDWLTKILVGVGLTQLTTLPGNLQQVATHVATGLGGAPSAIAFAGALLVVFNVCGFLLSYLWTRLYLPGEFRQADFRAICVQFTKVHERVTQVDAKAGNIVQERELDAKAINYALRQLNPDNPSVSPEVLAEAIKNASPVIRALIFSKAQEVRKDNWKENPLIMERLIPVFKGLIESDGEEHHYWGQLGYSLKDQPKHDWKGAESAFDKAIELRGPWQQQKGWVLYEFSRALCKIAQSKAGNGVPNTDGRLRKSIIDDLGVAIKGGLRDKVLRDPDDPDIKDWMETQIPKVSEKDFD